MPIIGELDEVLLEDVLFEDDISLLQDSTEKITTHEKQARLSLESNRIIILSFVE
jgi:hypothetical protein